jgi:gamma-glutamyltranspeptidase/glutathione hydrolase
MAPAAALLALALALFTLAAVATPAAALTPVGARHGMVVTSSAPATDAGVEILRRGGNAVDAAVAVGFALAVTHPAAGNIGGGGFMLVRMADGRSVAIDYRETAPAAAARDMYLDARGEVIPRASLRGPRAGGVPGTVAGLALALQRYGTMDLATVMRPAIDLARRGFPSATRSTARSSSRTRARRSPTSARSPRARASSCGAASHSRSATRCASRTWRGRSSRSRAAAPTPSTKARSPSASSAP